MFDNSILSIKSALSPICRILDSFEHINMQEHPNETLCFVGITGYKTAQSCVGINGNQFFIAEVKVSVDIVADRTMNATQLKSLADNAVVPTISNLGLSLISVERKNCEFSKSHSRYVTSIELELEDKISMPTVTTAPVLLNGALEPMLRTFRIIKGTKTSQALLVNKTMLSNAVSPMPNKIILSGKLPLAEADTALSRYSALSGITVPVNIGANVYTNMLLTSIELNKTSSSGCEITLELTEVNE